MEFLEIDLWRQCMRRGDIIYMENVIQIHNERDYNELLGFFLLFHLAVIHHDYGCHI